MGDTAFVLIVGNADARGDSLAEQLKRAGHACRVVHDGGEAIDSIRQRPPDVVITHYDLGGQTSGGDILVETKRISPETEVILITDPAGGQLAHDLVHAASPTRAFDVLAEPLDADALTSVVDRAARQALGNRESRAVREQRAKAFNFEGMIGSSPAMARIIDRIRRVANSKLTVLITGESGTGKELVARAIHYNSPRRAKSLRVINCAGLNENLLESELFGHVKGSFTGAVADRKGLFEAADGGTLFLDEVGDMPLPMQAKLLRALENGEITPVGSVEVRHVDVRVVAATKRDLGTMVTDATFRDDLYYRLKQVTIRLPSLRERQEDIPLLVEHFITEANARHDKRVTGISSEALRRLSNHQWQGNVRELRSAVDAMVVLADNEQIGVDDLPDTIRGTTEIVLAGGISTAGLSMNDMEKLHIANTLKMTGGNREKAAKVLGIGARTLYRKLKEYGLS
ncbi:MAG: sigma-54-dependent Fis family transcriptional regulator [Phycisphaerae bacterium]|nr:sigma-54-dependent Fis family transcriptional regulator [Phycisphaerae bacterium]